MSSSDIAISARGVSKSYTIRHAAAPATTFAEAIVQRIRHPFRRAEKEVFWALKDVSFEIKKGEVVGIIGRNGAGKSTLLKILSRITEMTTGEIDLFGRVGSLLEVGTGFHQELSGRENIFLNGAILGMTRAEIRKQFDAIVDFAGVDKFLDTPVKRYSSGMYVRLAFAVAAHLRSEILIVDEVLAVGDAEFQKKCLGKMKEVSTDGRTVLFVSHNVAAITSLCDVAIELSTGRLIASGPVDSVVKHYAQRSRPVESAGANDFRRPGSGEYRFVSARADRAAYAPEDEKRVEFKLVRRSGNQASLFIVAHLVDELGVIISRCDSRAVQLQLPLCDQISGSFAFRTPWLKPGEYRIDLQIGAGGLIDLLEDACRIEVLSEMPYTGSLPEVTLQYGVVLADFDFSLDEELGTLSQLAGQNSTTI